MTYTALLIPHIHVQNANALSSAYTIGFPAITAWLGAVHALQRELNTVGIAVNFDGVGIVSHRFNLQTYKGPGDFEYSIIGTGNPLDKNGERTSFIEEARCHLEVSLIIQCSNIKKPDESELIKKISHYLKTRIKIAGGDILEFEPPAFYRDFSLIKPKLMPGYALIERRELMVEAMKQGQDALDALLDYLAIHHSCEQNVQHKETIVTWRSTRKPTGQNGERGWIVPIATGFQGISELGQVKNQRDPETPHRFAEAIVTLGEFKMIYKLQSFDELFWHYHYDAENHLYLCQQTLSDSQTLFEKDGF
ncbi:type I-F CRISPR-associated protein Csy2 [Legionella dresdenensis]|uniref:Type I-F CRISPR-associated protein Csy2 n=1 Tax=Legionella dresdenensis TaxID=450200 RepID=A0ABV8CH62_9GAMM